MLELSNFKKSYGSHLVLDIKSALFSPAIYWIRGGNGSGKSTLLRAVAGAANFRGKLTVDQLSLHADGVNYRKMVNFAEAEPVYPTFLSGTELIGIFEATKGNGILPLNQMLDEMQMQGYLKSPLVTYSSGMLKKLSLVLAFIGRPKWVLLDEPLNALDQDGVITLYSWIRKAYIEQGIGFLLSSHQQLERSLLPETRIVDIVNRDLMMQ